MPRRFRKLHIGGVFALSEKLPDALRRLLPAYDLCGGQVSCRVPIGDVDAVLGVPRGISAVLGDDAVAAVEAALKKRRDFFHALALGELRGDLHAGIVGVALHAQNMVDIRLRDGHGKSGGPVALRFCDICDLLFLRGEQAQLVCLRYRDIRYSGEDLPPIKCFDTVGNVVVANSFSKIFSPGVRLGYVMAEPETIHYLTEAKSATNSHTSMLPQVLCAEFFKRGYYPAHHKMLCDLYRQRRDAMLECIDKYFPEGTKHSFPDGGLFTWVELPGDIDTAELLKESSTDPEVGVAFVAGAGFFVGGSGAGRNCMRMSFGNNSPEKIREGVMKLGKLIEKKLAQQSK